MAPGWWGRGGGLITNLGLTITILLSYNKYWGAGMLYSELKSEVALSRCVLRVHAQTIYYQESLAFCFQLCTVTHFVGGGGGGGVDFVCLFAKTISHCH
jgi:hypothetical protein